MEEINTKLGRYGVTKGGTVVDHRRAVNNFEADIDLNGRAIRGKDFCLFTHRSIENGKGVYLTFNNDNESLTGEFWLNKEQVNHLIELLEVYK